MEAGEGDGLLRILSRGWGDGAAGRCLPRKPEDLSSSPSACMKSQCVSVIPGTEGGALEFDDRSASQICEFQVSRKPCLKN